MKLIDLQRVNDFQLGFLREEKISTVYTPVSFRNVDDAGKQWLIISPGCNADGIDLFTILPETPQELKLIKIDSTICNGRNKAPRIQAFRENTYVVLIKG